MIKNILITGGAGFIGSHTADLLILNGYDVTVLDNLSTGSKLNVNKKAKFIFGDILNIDKNMSKFKDIDAVIHCAAQISVNKSIKQPTYDANINIIGSLKLLEVCRKLSVKKFVFASSCAVYGLQQRFVSESHIEKPENPYAIGKRSVEMYMDFYNRQYDIECASLRYANVYGPRQNYFGEAGVVTIFINQLLRNNKPAIFGDGNQTRDFIYVEDVALANLLTLKKKTLDKLNIGTGKETTINNLLSKIKLLLGKEKINPVYKAVRNAEVRFSSLSIKLAKKELDWKPATELTDGLKKTIEWSKIQNKTL